MSGGGCDSWSGEINWNPRSSEKIHPVDISVRSSTLVKWAGNAHGLPAGCFATHSLRSGGASAMFVAWGDLSRH